MCTKFNRYAKTGFKREREREREIKTFCPEMVTDEEKGVVVAKKVRGEIEKKEGTHVLSTLSLSFSDRT